MKTREVRTGPRNGCRAPHTRTRGWRRPGLGIALVITVNSVSAGMTQAQDRVLRSLYASAPT